MNALETARGHYLERARAFAPSRGDEPGWLARLRREALDSFAEQGLPSTRLEGWRYTNMKPLAEVPFELASGRPGRVGEEQVESLALPLFACSLFVFPDGRFEPGLSAPRALAGAPPVESLARLLRSAPERLEPHLGRLAPGKGHPFAALNTAFLEDGAVIRVPPGEVVPNPLHVVFVSAGGEGPTMSHPRILVVAEGGSQVTVIQDHISLGGAPALSNSVIEVCALQGSDVRLVLLQREAPGNFVVSNLHARLERDARFAAHTVTVGGRLVRNDACAVLADTGADCTLNGLFLGTGRSIVDNHTLIDHAMPHGTSRELYKGILGGRSRGVFRGRVIVRPDAQKTNARQSNPNLMITDSAEVDTRPQLEIYADDVKCSHGSSVGSLDEEALFYLRSRCIGEDRARELLTRAFGGEILRALPVPALGEELGSLLLRRLSGTRGLEDLP